MNKTPNPGSDEALAAGCLCSVRDNGHGKGWMGGATDPETGEVLFWMDADCPLHGVEAGRVAVEGE